MILFVCHRGLISMSEVFKGENVSKEKKLHRSLDFKNVCSPVDMSRPSLFIRVPEYIANFIAMTFSTAKISFLKFDPESYALEVIFFSR